MKTISVKVPERLNDQLTQIAAARHEPKSQLIREALEKGLAGWMSAEGSAQKSLMQKYAGLFDGREDLSENKEHFQGFGE